MAGSDALMQRLCERLGVAPARSMRKAASASTAVLHGLCDQGPALLVNHHQVVTRLDAKRVDQLAERLLAGVPPEDWPADWFAVDDHVRRADVLLNGLPADAPRCPPCCPAHPPSCWPRVERSGLRGPRWRGFPDRAQGGAPAAEADAPDGQRCVVCNADEGEPGTFKDRVLLSRHADELFDGMTLAARAIGAQTGLVYLRGEYRFLCRSSKPCCSAAVRRACSGAMRAVWPGLVSTSPSTSERAPMSAAKSRR